MTTTSRATELDVINQMLSCIGEAPIQSLVDEANEDSLMAQQTLDEVCRELAEKDHWFNRELEVVFTPNALGHIEIPENAWTVESSYKKNLRVQYIIKSQRLYDLESKTDVFTSNVLLDVTYIREWDDLPPVAQSYVAARASRKLADRLEKHDATHRNLRQDEEEARRRLVAADTRVQDPNLLQGHPVNRYGRGRRGYADVW